MEFGQRLLELQRGLAGQLQPCAPMADARRRFWRIGRVGTVGVDVVDEAFDTGVSAPAYVADHGDTVILTSTEVGVDAFMTVVEEARAQQRFWHEQARFRAALPVLLTDPRWVGHWVVFSDGVVVHAAGTREDATAWATSHIDLPGGHIIAQVAPPHVHRIGGARRSMA